MMAAFSHSMTMGWLGCCLIVLTSVRPPALATTPSSLENLIGSCCSYVVSCASTETTHSPVTVMKQENVWSRVTCVSSISTGSADKCLRLFFEHDHPVIPIGHRETKL